VFSLLDDGTDGDSTDGCKPNSARSGLSDCETVDGVPVNPHLPALDDDDFDDALLSSALGRRLARPSFTAPTSPQLRLSASVRQLPPISSPHTPTKTSSKSATVAADADAAAGAAGAAAASPSASVGLTVRGRLTAAHAAVLRSPPGGCPYQLPSLRDGAEPRKPVVSDFGGVRNFDRRQRRLGLAASALQAASTAF
jgi:hypothetical protein